MRKGVKEIIENVLSGLSLLWVFFLIYWVLAPEPIIPRGDKSTVIIISIISSACLLWWTRIYYKSIKKTKIPTIEVRKNSLLGLTLGYSVIVLYLVFAPTTFSFRGKFLIITILIGTVIFAWIIWIIYYKYIHKKDKS